MSKDITSLSIAEDIQQENYLQPQTTEKVKYNGNGLITADSGNLRPQPEQPAGDILKGVYIPNWDNRPEEKQPLITLDGTGILTHQNITSSIAKPGMGKSSIVEANVSSVLNPDCDCLGFAVDPMVKRLLVIDTERTDTDVWNSFYRAHKRAGIDRHKNTDNITIAGLRFVARVEQRRKIIEQFIIEKEPTIVIIDGAADLVNDTNNLEEAIACRAWMRDLTVIYQVSIFLTLHPNPASDKPRGHLGSELCRESECVLLIKPYDDNTRIITSDFEHGKNRNNPKLTTAYRWSEEAKMFVSADYNEVQINKLKRKGVSDRDKLVNIVKEILPAPNAMKHDELKTVIEEKYEVSDKTARRRITDMIEMTVIKKHDDGYYRMIIN